MLANGGGSIINMSSVTALLGRTGNLHYVTSKAAQLGFTRSLARELGDQGVRVNAIVIGAIETPSEAVYGDPDEIARMLYELQSIKRRGLPRRRRADGGAPRLGPVVVRDRPGDHRRRRLGDALSAPTAHRQRRG